MPQLVPSSLIEEEKQFERRRDEKSNDVNLSAPVLVQEQAVSEVSTVPHQANGIEVGSLLLFVTVHMGQGNCGTLTIYGK